MVSPVEVKGAKKNLSVFAPDIAQQPRRKRINRVSTSMPRFMAGRMANGGSVDDLEGAPATFMSAPNSSYREEFMPMTFAYNRNHTREAKIDFLKSNILDDDRKTVTNYTTLSQASYLPHPVQRPKKLEEETHIPIEGRMRTGVTESKDKFSTPWQRIFGNSSIRFTSTRSHVKHARQNGADLPRTTNPLRPWKKAHSYQDITLTSHK